MQTLAKLTDDQLVQSYAKGNPEAFDVLLQRHQSKLLNYITQHCNNAQLAEDIFQETFVKAIVTIQSGNYTDNGKFANWLFRIARNLVIDHFRRESVECTYSTDDKDFDVL
ncbi:sigma-70 family RNA polymerase sigma factor, partial [uncultured Muribaculum sp.]|uniref:sigma-70 family RNA polymerase sigma factor n=1 Tax=uncultured Muribaculum sp. TaxID=1918613 RepID=UPI0026E38561